MDEARESHAIKLWAWILLQAVLPCGVVVLTWLAAKLLFGVQLAFEKTFVGADLILVGALVLTTLIIEVWAEQRRLRQRTKFRALDRLWIVSAAFTFFAIACFGLLKAKAVQYDFPQKGDVDRSIEACAVANIVLGAFAIIWGSAVAVFAHRKFLEAELNE